MKNLASWSLLACLNLADASNSRIQRSQLDSYNVETLPARALPNSPSGGYAPASVDCPTERPAIRNAMTLSPEESAWLPIRRNATIEPMKAFLANANISGFDAAAYISRIQGNASALPNIGIACSGGGYRALMNGAGFLAAADSRTINATGPGQIGGLLQSATYLAGLSGGSWLLTSVYINNFTSIQTLRDGSKGSSVWQFGNSIFEGPESSGIQLFSSVEYFDQIIDDVGDKSNAGFETTITDYWGRALSYQLINATHGGPSYTFSSISDSPDFQAGQMPFPMFVVDSRAEGQSIISLNSTVFEFNPFEMGSWDPTLFAFAPTKYIGTNFTDGTVADNEKCIAGLDQAGYVTGTSSTLFNTFLLNINSTGLPSSLTSIFTDILEDIGDANEDIAVYSPNPFYGFQKSNNRNAASTSLTLVDGGEDLQNIPLNPLIQPIRHVDVIFAADSSADTTYYWPNGTALVATYARSQNSTITNGTAFPSIPDVNTFVNLGLNNRPTFFGCDSSNLTGPAPIVVYIPNAPYITQSNYSTFDPDYSNAVRNAVIENGHNVATMGNGTLDSEWPACVACAVLSRSFERTGQTVPSQCTACFSRYCWDGTLNATTPNNYNPEYKLGELKITSGAARSVGRSDLVAVVVAGVMAMAFAI